MNDSKDTLDTILAVSKNEFLEKGFAKASLRNIAKKCNITTGAIYGYFKSKDDLFYELVKDTIQDLYKLVDKLEADKTFNDYMMSLDSENLISVSKKIHIQYIDFIYKNYDSCKLVLLCAQGSRLENFQKELIDYSYHLSETYKNHINSKNSVKIGSFVMNFLIKTFINIIIDFIRYDVPYEDALKKADTFFTFFFGGINALLNN